jgi:hypothetical protein
MPTLSDSWRGPAAEASPLHDLRNCCHIWDTSDSSIVTLHDIVRRQVPVAIGRSLAGCSRNAPADLMVTCEMSQ